jgi:hypothetical protein
LQEAEVPVVELRGWWPSTGKAANKDALGYALTIRRASVPW